jgi:hypothetical protein
VPQQPDTPPPPWKNTEAVEMAMDILRGRQLLAVEQAKARLENAKTPKEDMAAHLRKADGGIFNPERMVEVLESVLQIKATIGEVAQATSDVSTEKCHLAFGVPTEN